jgi:SAM-dependent methyltransferase
VAQLEFDEATAKQLEVVYGTRDIVRRRRLVREALGASPGERILDIGCGPGFYVVELLDQVGPEGSVVGVDASEAMLAICRRRCEGRENVELYEAAATALPIDDASVDAALSVQVLEYVDDIATALGEIHRALRPGGRVVLWDVDWATLSLQTSDEARMERILGAWDEHLADPSLPRTLGAHLRSAGFEDVRVEAHAFAASGRDPEKFGAALVPFIATFVAGRQGIGNVEAEAWAAEQYELMERDEFYFVSTQFSFTATKTA